MKVSKDGVNVKTGDIADMVLHSEHYGLKIALQGSTTFTVTSGAGGSKSIAHGLSYIPGFLAFCKMTGSKYYPPSSWDYESGFEQFLASTDATNINFSIDSNAITNYTATVYYFILVDPGQ